MFILIAAGLSLSVLGYLLALATFRLLVHPLAKVPGPRLAGLTGWYEFYYDCPKKGNYVFKVQEMHEKYGQVVRISPNRGPY